MKVLTSIDEVLKHDISYPAFTPVILFDRSPWEKFVLRYRLLAAIVLIVIAALVLPASARGNESALRQHKMKIGTAVEPAFLKEPAYAATLAREFNMLEAENSMKWETIHPAKGHYDFRDGDALVRFAEQNKMAVRGHCLIWGKHLPNWLASPALPSDAVLRDHIKNVVGHYRGRVFAWDVVNEPFFKDGTLPASGWLSESEIERAFVWAHAADPSAKLFLNEFDVEELNTKSNGLYTMVKDFKRRGVPIDGIGFQMHLTVDGLNIASFKLNMARFAALGVELQITELDVAVGKQAFARQATIYGDVVGACVAQPACTAIQTWGFTDAHSWIPAGNALLFDKDYRAKPAYAAVAGALSKGGK